MSIFRKKNKSENEEDLVYIPQIISSNEHATGVNSRSESYQLMNRKMDIEESRIQNEKYMVDNVCHTVNTGLNAVRDIAGFVTQCQQMHEHTEQLRMMTNVQLENVTAKYKATKDYMQQAFGERGKALDKYYLVLDKAIESNDRDMIIQSMQGISNIVATSPLQDINEFQKLFNDASKPLLDF